MSTQTMEAPLITRRRFLGATTLSVGLVAGKCIISGSTPSSEIVTNFLGKFSALMEALSQTAEQREGTLMFGDRLNGNLSHYKIVVKKDPAPLLNKPVIYHPDPNSIGQLIAWLPKGTVIADTVKITKSDIRGGEYRYAWDDQFKEFYFIPSETSKAFDGLPINGYFSPADFFNWTRLPLTID